VGQEKIYIKKYNNTNNIENNICPTIILQGAGTQGQDFTPGGQNSANHQAEVEIKTPTGPRILRIADLNKPTEAEIDLADEMLTRLAEQPGPVSEGDIIGAVDADPTLARNILYRLSVDGIVEPLPGGLYQIPDYPPPAANLPEGCPLLGGPFPETGCRFHPRLFKTLYEQGVIPLPDGRCPLRNVCKI
jgi:hypothetical protein